jgi:hypothetical protein
MKRSLLPLLAALALACGSGAPRSITPTGVTTPPKPSPTTVPSSAPDAGSGPSTPPPTLPPTTSPTPALPPPALPPPALPPPPDPPPPPTTTTTPGGTTPPASTGGLRIQARRLYFVDAPLTGEPSFAGDVLVEASDGSAPPAGTAVTLNGVALVRDPTPGVQPKYWRVDPTGRQPQPASDGSATLVATAGGLAQTLVLPCAPDVAVTTSTAPGSGLAAALFLQFDWSVDLDVNPENTLVTDFYPSAHLYPLDPSGTAVAPGEASHDFVPKVARNAVLPIPPGTGGGWVGELRWQGTFVTGDSAGFCGRAKRFHFVN